MPSAISNHDIYGQGATQYVTLTASTTVTAQSAAFGAQTRAVCLCYADTASNTAGVKFSVGDGTPSGIATQATSQFLPPNWMYFQHVNPGQFISFVNNNATSTPSISVTELIL